MMSMIGLDDAHHYFLRCAWPDSLIRMTSVVHLGLTNCEYMKNLRTMYRRRAIFEQDLNFFVSFLRLFVEIS